MMALIGLLLPAAVSAQNPQPQQGPGGQAGPPVAAEPVVELILLREVFQYPGFARRNPFVPLTSAADGGPRFEQMRLIGIAYSESPAMTSVATLTAGGGAPTGVGPAQVTTGQSNMLRVGERWGNVRVLQIFKDYIVVEVTEYGVSENREMRIQARGQGGS